MPQPYSPIAGFVGRESCRDNDRAHVEGKILRALQTNRHHEIADVTCLRRQFGIGIENDVLVAPNLLEQVCDDLGAMLMVGAHPTDLRGPSARLALALDDKDRQSHSSERECGAHAGHAGADHQNAFLGFDPDGGEGVCQSRLGHSGAHKVDAFRRGAGFVALVHPGALLAEIAVNVLVGIQTGAFRHGAEGEHVKFRRTRGDDEAVQFLFPDLVDHLLLRRIRAGEQMCPRDLDVRFVCQRLRDVLHITWSEMFPPQWHT